VAELRAAAERLRAEVAAQGLALAGLAAERDACRAAAAAADERCKARRPARRACLATAHKTCRPQQTCSGPHKRASADGCAASNLSARWPGSGRSRACSAPRARPARAPPPRPSDAPEHDLDPNLS